MTFLKSSFDTQNYNNFITTFAVDRGLGTLSVTRNRKNKVCVWEGVR